jgi:hypothetical protein
LNQFRSGLREALRRSRTLRRVVRWCRARTLADPHWEEVLGADAAAFRAAIARARGGPRVLLATSIGGYWAGTSLESLLAVALTLRGAEVEVLLCDGILPACQACEARGFGKMSRFASEGPQKTLCGGCFPAGRKLFEGLGLTVHRFSRFISAEEASLAERTASTLPFAEIEGCRLEGVAVGEHAKAGALRFFARGDLEGEPSAEPVLRRYLRAAMLSTFAARRLLGERRFQCAAFHHGIYVPQGLIGEVARAQEVRVVNWNPAYRKRCFIFSHGDSYHHTLLKEPVTAWEGIGWGAELEEELLGYLKSRSRGTEDWIWFNRSPDEELEPAARKLGLDLTRPLVGLLTNVLWDAQLHYPANAFPGMMDWLLATVAHFSKRPELQLVIRVHPAEVRGSLPSRQRVAGELSRRFPRLPPNVVVVGPESNLSTYALMSRANAVLIYGTKTGVELSALGIPVIVAGEAWVRNKGFTQDARSAEHYLELLGKLPFEGRLRPEEMERARKYAYHFFFRRMIPLECMEPTGGEPPYLMKLRRMEELLPGRMAGLDVILDGILTGSPFIYRAEERVGPVERRSAAATGG